MNKIIIKKYTEATIIKQILACFMTLYFCISSYSQKIISLTIDDPNTYEKLLSWQQINNSILSTLNENKIKAALFVCGMRIDNEAGTVLLTEWDNNNHLICNHSYSHKDFNSKNNFASDFIKDFNKCDSLIKGYKNYTKLFRFPFLKEGETKEKTDSMRTALKAYNYKNGLVSIDASDWYIDLKMTEQLKLNPNADLSPYRDYYIKHILSRAKYYLSLSYKINKPHIKHTLLLHHSLLNAFFLNDIIQALKTDGWKFIDAKEAFADIIYNQKPNIEPCGESIIWQLAEQNGKYSYLLRYPGEDGEYEEIPLKLFLKNYKYKKLKSVLINKFLSK